MRDINSNPVSGKSVTFASSLANSSVGTVTDQGDGRYTASLTGTTAGSSNITALVGGSAFGVTAAQVTLTADGGNLGTSQSTLAAAPGTLVADGSAAALITLTLRDINNNPVSGKSVTFASSIANSSVGTVTDQGDGRYTASLTGTTAGSSNITALVGGSAFGVTAAQVTLTADGGNLGTTQSTLTAAPGSIVADGSAAALITLTLRDINSNPVSGKTVTFASSLANSSVGSVTDQGDGRYTASLTGTTAGSSNITALVGGSAFGVTAAQVTLTADGGNLGTSQSTLTAAPGTILADGSAAALITLTLRDINSNPVSGKTVTFASSLANSSVGSVTDQGDGRYTASLTGTTAGSSNITALVGGSAFGVTAAQVTLTPDASTAAITALSSAEPNVAVAVVTDSGNNLVEGVTVTFSVPDGSGISFVSSSTVVTGATGNASLNFIATDADAGAATTLTATVTNTNNQVSSKSLNIKVVPNFAKATVNTQLNTPSVPFDIASGFPTTGFTNATFQLAPHGNTAQNSNYTWASSQPSVVTVDNTGIVTMAEEPSGEVTITAQWNSDALVVFTYKFTINTWFAYALNGLSSGSAAIATTNCINRGYARIPTMSEMLLTTPATGTGQRGIGAVWAEWGNLTNYPGSGFPGTQQRIWVTTDSGTGQVMVTLGNVSVATPAILGCMN